MSKEAKGDVLVRLHKPAPLDLDTLFRALNETTETSQQLYQEISSFRRCSPSYKEGNAFEVPNWKIWQKAIHLARMAEHVTRLLALDTTTLRSPYMPKKAKDES